MKLGTMRKFKDEGVVHASTLPQSGVATWVNSISSNDDAKSVTGGILVTRRRPSLRCRLGVLQLSCPNKWLCTRLASGSRHTSQTVATPLWPSVGVKPNTWKSWRLGVFRDSRMFKAQQQRAKHLALGCSWCHWKGLET